MKMDRNSKKTNTLKVWNKVASTHRTSHHQRPNSLVSYEDLCLENDVLPDQNLNFSKRQVTEQAPFRFLFSGTLLFKPGSQANA
jgi:hypothetical protein